MFSQFDRPTSFFSLLPFQRNTQLQAMVIVVGSPIPEDQFGFLELLIGEGQLSTRTNSECAQSRLAKRSNAELHCSSGCCVLIL